jgi:hypothetical protein
LGTGRGLLLLLLGLLLLALTATPALAGDIVIVLKADTGKYAARCHNCIPDEKFPDNVAVHETDPSKPFGQWKLQKLDNGNYTLQSVDSGKYAARCNSCIANAMYPDSVFVHVDDPNHGYAQWKLRRLDNGKYILQSADSGKYFARCNGCAPGSTYPDNVFVHESNPEKAPWAQWELIVIP